MDSSKYGLLCIQGTSSSSIGPITSCIATGGSTAIIAKVKELRNNKIIFDEE